MFWNKIMNAKVKDWREGSKIGQTGSSLPPSMSNGWFYNQMLAMGTHIIDLTFDLKSLIASIEYTLCTEVVESTMACKRV